MRGAQACGAHQAFFCGFAVDKFNPKHRRSVTLQEANAAIDIAADSFLVVNTSNLELHASNLVFRTEKLRTSSRVKRGTPGVRWAFMWSKVAPATSLRPKAGRSSGAAKRTSTSRRVMFLA